MLKNSATAINQKADDMRSKKESHDVNEANSGGFLGDLNKVTPRVTADQLPDEDSIYYLSDEDPDAAPEALVETWENPVSNDWYESHSEAMKVARRSGSPVLIWFTNSKHSPTCKLLDREVFSTKVFKDWAEDKVVRLQVDSNVVEGDTAVRLRKKEYVKKLKERYNVLGAPVVVVLSPRDSVFGNYAGYKGGNAEFYFGRLRQAYRVAMQDYGKWKESMEKRGYRIWHDNRGRSVFAKLKRYHNGQLLLVDPDGNLSRTHERKLSVEDRQYIADEKAKRSSR
ncbi:Thioredoxin-like [Rubritalea squalenifaciens DSM 18772]|uniref:Thioredoxin-like n=2 Tax=Rubritalea squalenifaciens TaxID=407226 RepID=A0A1M6IH75_9BACT|nr:Thioredoxin-like [Rubritalea squalenifaciens DSM 18772]